MPEHDNKRRGLRSSPSKPIRCANPICGVVSEQNNLHHIIHFKHVEGSDEPWNLISLCHICHRACHDGVPGFGILDLFAWKYTSELEVWRKKLVTDPSVRITEKEILLMLRDFMKQAKKGKKRIVAIGNMVIDEIKNPADGNGTQ